MKNGCAAVVLVAVLGVLVDRISIRVVIAVVNVVECSVP